MKKLLMMFVMICLGCLSVAAQDKVYYFEGTEGTGFRKFTFYTDKENDYVVEVSFGGSIKRYKYLETTGGQLKFQEFDFAPEQKMVSVYYSPFPIPQMTGRIIKSYKAGKYLFVMSDYNRAYISGTDIYKRTTKSIFDAAEKIVLVGGTPNYNYGNSSSGGTIKNDAYNKPTNKHGAVACKSCNGTGRCNYCNGMGYFRNYDDTKTQCATCQGRGKCGVCYGTGRIRY